MLVEKETLLLAGATSALVVIAFALGVAVGTPPGHACPHRHPFSIDGGPTMIAPVSPMVIPDRDADGGGEVFYFREDGYPVVVRYEREVRVGGER